MKNLDEATLDAKPTETLIDLQNNSDIKEKNNKNFPQENFLEGNSQLSPIFRTAMLEKIRTMEKIQNLDHSSKNEETTHTKKQYIFSHLSKVVPIRSFCKISDFEKEEESKKDPPSLYEMKENENLEKKELPPRKESMTLPQPITHNIDSNPNKDISPEMKDPNHFNSEKNELNSPCFPSSSPSFSNEPVKQEVQIKKEDPPTHIVIEKVVKIGDSLKIDKTIQPLISSRQPTQSKLKLQPQPQPQFLLSFFPRSSLEALVRNARGATRNELKLCRFCLYPELKDNNLLIPCGCEGNGRFVHTECLKTWIIIKKQIDKPKCEVCQVCYNMTFEIERKFTWFFGRPDLIINLIIFILLVVLMGAITSLVVVMTVGWSRDLHLGESSEIILLIISIIAMIINFYVILKFRKQLLYKWKVKHWKIFNRAHCPQKNVVKKKMKEGTLNCKGHKMKGGWEKFYEFIKSLNKKCEQNYLTSTFFKYDIAKTSFPRYSYNMCEKLVNLGGQNQQQSNKTNECFKNKFRKTLIDVNYKKLKVDLNGFLAEIPEDLIDSQNTKKMLHLLMEVDRKTFENIKNLTF